MGTYERYRIKAKELGIGYKTFAKRIKRGWSYHDASTLPIGTRKKRDIALYKGDTFLFIGSKRECAEHLNVSEERIKQISSQKYRLIAEEHGKIYGTYINEEEL